MERRFITRLFVVSASRRRGIFKLILPVRTYKTCRLALRRVVLRWIEGDSASLAPGATGADHSTAQVRSYAGVCPALSGSACADRALLLD